MFQRLSQAFALPAAVAASLVFSAPSRAEDSVKIGLILPMTGPSASTGREIEAAVKLFQATNGDKAGGKKVEVILKDDTGVADITKRLAQELIVNDKVAVIAGFGLTPLALAAAPLATQAKVPEIVMAAGTATITEASPYIVRTSFTLPQATVPIADWAAQERHQEGRHAGRPTTARASTPRRLSGKSSRRPAARCSTACARRCAIPNSRLSSRRRRISSPTRSSCSCRPVRALR